MNKPRLVVMAVFAVLGAVAMLMTVIRSQKAQARNGNATRGEYLVKSLGCGDCHTPMKSVNSGFPEPDSSRLLSGHPADLVMPPVPRLDGPWAGAFSFTMTAWFGPWGISYAANITSDSTTGVGDWSAEDFVKMIRTGRHRGEGRPILPPMPVPSLQNLDDTDLDSVLAYLGTIPPIQNRVPDPLRPEIRRVRP